MKKVTVVVPCRNEHAYIRRCVEALMRQDYPQELTTIVICDALSDDGTRLVLDELKLSHPNLVVLDNPQKVTPVALNLGIKYNHDDIKIILGAHSEVYPDFVRSNVEVLNEHPECSSCGGWWENVYENEDSIAIGLAMSSPFGVGNAHYRTSAAEGYVDTAGFGAYRSDVFDKIGYFDEELVRNQDDDFNFRLTNSGMKIWLSKRIRCKYYVRASFQKLSKQQFQYGYWKVFVNKKHGTITTMRQLVPAAFVTYLILAAIWMLFSRTFIFIIVAPLVLYFVLAFAEAIRLSRSGVAGVPKVIGAFLVLHTSYGWGYLRGILQFIILNSKPSGSSKSVTR